MTLEEAVDNACRDLPEGYTVALYMENGSAYVQLIDKTGEMLFRMNWMITLNCQISSGLA
jgi:hypothetical protein